MNYFIITILILVVGLASYFRSEHNNDLHLSIKPVVVQKQVLKTASPEKTQPILSDDKTKNQEKIIAENNIPQFTEEEKYFLSVADEERRAYFEKIDNPSEDEVKKSDTGSGRYPSNEGEKSATIEDKKNEL